MTGGVDAVGIDAQPVAQVGDEGIDEPEVVGPGRVTEVVPVAGIAQGIGGHDHVTAGRALIGQRRVGVLALLVAGEAVEAEHQGVRGRAVVVVGQRQQVCPYPAVEAERLRALRRRGGPGRIAIGGCLPVRGPGSGRIAATVAARAARHQTDRGDQQDGRHHERPAPGGACGGGGGAPPVSDSCLRRRVSSGSQAIPS